MQSKLRLAVIGAGMMGRRHLTAIKANPDIELVAVADSDPACAEIAAKEFGCAVTAPGALAGKIDGAVIAVPTAFHAAVAVPLLQAGIGCLVEKPLAANEAEGRALIEAARAGSVVLQVGHIERFNPAVEALSAQAIGPIKAMAARRMSAASARVTDIDVVNDLMVHDLDVALALKNSPVAKVSAGGSDDHAVALVEFADGATATFTASRITPGRVRDLDVTGDAFFHLDFIARAVTRQDQAVSVIAGDALAAQLRDFTAAIRERRAPRVSGAQGLAVLTLAARINAARRGVSL